MENAIQNQLTLVSEIQVSYNPIIRASQRPQIGCSRDAQDLLRQIWDSNLIEYVEEFKLLLLNRANRVLGIVAISKGGVAGTVADPKIIFGVALKANASSIILAHNHPSGNLKPSEADKQLTKKLMEGGKLLDLVVSDHIILTGENYYSFADDGLMY